MVRLTRLRKNEVQSERQKGNEKEGRLTFFFFFFFSVLVPDSTKKKEKKRCDFVGSEWVRGYVDRDRRE